MCNFLKYRYVKSDLTQSGVLTVVLLFFSVKLNEKNEKDKEVKQFENVIF